MPKNNVTDLITDQETSFARLVLSGTMTDHQAAKAAGLNPDTAAYTKAKPGVRAYMLEHRAAVEQKLVEQEIDALRRQTLHREQVRQRVLDCLWELARTSPEKTRGSITNQVKAISMIVAIEGLIPDRRAANNKSARPPIPADRFSQQQEKTTGPLPNPALAHEEDEPATSESLPDPAEDAPSDPGVSNAAHTPSADFVPDTRIPFSQRHPWPGRR